MTGAIMSAAQPFTPALFSSFVEWIDRGNQTAKTYINHLRQFFAWTRYREIMQPIRKDVAAFRDWLLSEHEGITIDNEAPEGWRYRRDPAGRVIVAQCTPNTTAQYLRSVKQFFRWTGSNGLYPDIAANIRPPKISRGIHKRDALTTAEVLTVENSIKENAAARIRDAGNERKDTVGRMQRKTEQGARLLAMYQLAVTAGLRTVELSRARIRDFEEKGGRFFLYIHGKGHSEADEKKPLAPEVAAAIKEYLKIRAGGYSLAGSLPLFAATGNRNAGGRIEPRTIGSMIKAALRTAGMDSHRLTAHSLRHTAGTALFQLTGNLYAVQKYMRHASPTTTEIYLHADTEQQEADFAEKLYDLFHGGDAADQLEKI